MRRRLLIATLVLDGLCALAAPAVLARISGGDDAYVRVGGLCVEVMEVHDEHLGDVVGRPVAMDLCGD